jgi:hypothetical protein
MSAVVERLSQGLRIRTGWPVTSITYDAGGWQLCLLLLLRNKSSASGLWMLPDRFCIALPCRVVFCAAACMLAHNRYILHTVAPGPDGVAMPHIPSAPVISAWCPTPCCCCWWWWWCFRWRGLDRPPGRPHHCTQGGGHSASQGAAVRAHPLPAAAAASQAGGNPAVAHGECSQGGFVLCGTGHCSPACCHRDSLRVDKQAKGKPHVVAHSMDCQRTIQPVYAAPMP